jgi:hypothetical protein
MRANGGFATLGHLYKTALKIPGVEWTTKTPFKSINRIVQDKTHFFRIRPGLWALNSLQDRLPEELLRKPKPESDHTYYQGLLAELGRLRKLQAFVPKQDQNRVFLGKALGDVVELKDIHPFTYDEVVRKASTIDVIWFNGRRMPTDFIEVENTTDMHGAFLKFVMLDGFYSTFRIVAPAVRIKEFTAKLVHPAFSSIAKRTKFNSYDVVSEMHSKASEAVALEERWAG